MLSYTSHNITILSLFLPAIIVCVCVWINKSDFKYYLKKLKSNLVSALESHKTQSKSN